MDKKIQELLQETTLDSKKELILILTKRAKKKQSNQSLYWIFQQYLIDSKVLLSNPFVMVGPRRGLSCFVSEFLSLYVKVQDFEQQVRLLNSLMLDLDNLHESQNPMLKMTTTKRLLEILEQFGARRYLAYNSNHVPLRFYFLPYGNKSMNACYFPHLHLVVLYKNNLDPESSPEYIFMHEIGHAIQLYFTKDQTVVPDSFKEVSVEMFKPCSDEVLVEVFADCFSAAVMKGTPFEEKNYFCTAFLQEHQTLLRDYFLSIFTAEKR